jgi:hypothetical protein
MPRAARPSPRSRLPGPSTLMSTFLLHLPIYLHIRSPDRSSLFLYTWPTHTTGHHTILSRDTELE